MRHYVEIHPEDRSLQTGCNAQFAGRTGVIETDIVHGNIRVGDAAHMTGIGGKLRSYFEALTPDFARDGHAATEDHRSAPKRRADLDERLRLYPDVSCAALRLSSQE